MIRKLAPYTKGYRVWIFLGVLCSAGEAVLELLLPQIMSDIVDRSWTWASPTATRRTFWPRA